VFWGIAARRPPLRCAPEREKDSRPENARQRGRKRERRNERHKASKNKNKKNQTPMRCEKGITIKRKKGGGEREKRGEFREN
jgi:hypothetical protein